MNHVDEEIERVKHITDFFQVITECNEDFEVKCLTRGEMSASRFLDRYAKDNVKIEADEKIEIQSAELNNKLKQLLGTHKVGFDRDKTNAISNALKGFSVETLKHYTGHGEVRGSNFQNAIRILETNAITGFVGHLSDPESGGATAAYLDGSILVVSKRDASLAALKEGKLIRVEIVEGEKKIIATKLDAGAIVVSGRYDVLVEPLRKMYPLLNILHAEELKDYINQQEALVAN